MGVFQREKGTQSIGGLAYEPSDERELESAKGGPSRRRAFTAARGMFGLGNPSPTREGYRPAPGRRWSPEGRTFPIFTRRRAHGWTIAHVLPIAHRRRRRKRRNILRNCPAPRHCLEPRGWRACDRALAGTLQGR